MVTTGDDMCITIVPHREGGHLYTCILNLAMDTIHSKTKNETKCFVLSYYEFPWTKQSNCMKIYNVLKSASFS